MSNIIVALCVIFGLCILGWYIGGVITNWVPSSLEAGVLKKATFELDSGGLKTIITYEPAEE